MDSYCRKGGYRSLGIQFFFALMLKPIVGFFERKLRNRILAIFLSYVLALIPLFALLLFFINQSRILFSDLPSVRGRLNEVMTSAFEWLDDKFRLDADSTSQWISDNILVASDIPINLIQESVQSTGYVIANMVFIVVITYFMLLYRTAFKNFFLAQIKPESRERVVEVLHKIQTLTKRYMMGQGAVIVILGLLIGSGLWLIGVPYPFFWGFLAGFLEIIPYVGTSIGGILPVFYMLMVSDTLWQPVAVVVLYIIVQQIEGNIISPNIMGPSIKINPMFIILGLFIGGILWGISGMILALPILAVSKEIFRSFDATEPLSYLMENGLSRKSAIFLERFDHDKNRLFRLFFEELATKP
ncbi:AI-2E family transporter [Maribacter sp. ACAM166]|uniref:AI-2E family transporter n=1 Tax=Maribacter sp. ACAM166 TaxID=2508996 RepID=UPI0010FF0947|nr:AI-2E family transporter [Maribacter sp. ACAM166]TLP81806.1 AI-2E family transporter [Maribacter sp. ACAM166]